MQAWLDVSIAAIALVNRMHIGMGVADRRLNPIQRAVAALSIDATLMRRYG